MSSNTQTGSLSSQGRGLFYYSSFVFVSTFVLLAAGGLVTSHEAGLAVPDWPLSYGQLMPPMVGNIAWEHGHRMIAGFVGILTLILAIVTQIFDSRKWMKRLGWIALGAVILQALLGGLTVIFLLPPAISIFHACLGQTFFCLLLAIVYFQSQTFKKTPSFGFDELPSKRLYLITTCLIYLQLILGAGIRHTEMTVIPHIVVGIVVLVHAGLIVRRSIVSYSTVNRIIRPALAIGFLTVIQVFLGLGSLMFTRVMERGYAPAKGEVLFTAAHQSVGAIILATSFFMTLVFWTQKKSST